MSVDFMSWNRYGTNHQKYLDGSICNHLSGDGFDGHSCQEIFGPLVFCFRVKLCSHLCQVSLCSSMVAVDAECDLEGLVDQWFGCN